MKFYLIFIDINFSIMKFDKKNESINLVYQYLLNE